MKKNRNEEQLALAGTEEGEILSRLGERVEKAVQTIQELRRERDTLKEKLAKAEAQLAEHGQASSRLTSLEEEHDRFKRERGQIRDRIESILSNLESLESAETE